MLGINNSKLDFSKIWNDPPWGEATGKPLWERVKIFIEELPVTSGILAGQKMKLLPYQVEILQGIFRETTPVDGSKPVRLTRNALVSISRKQGKSVLCAGIVCAALANGPLAEPRGQVYVCARGLNQASLLMDEVMAFIEQTPWLKACVTYQRYRKLATCHLTGTVFKAIPSDGKSILGTNPSLYICDEIGSFKNDSMYTALQSGSAARANPLGICISTQAADDIHFFSRMLDSYAQSDDPRNYVYLRACPEDVDPYSEEAWGIAAPALGHFVTKAFYEAEAERAKSIPTYAPIYKNLLLNQRVSVAEHWIGPDDWDACQEDIPIESLYGREVWGGLDLSSTNDLTSFVLYEPISGAILHWCWMPKERVKAREADSHVPFQSWIDRGFIETIDGKAIDRRWLSLRIADICSKFSVREIYADRWQLDSLLSVFHNEGISLPIQPIGQGFKDFSGLINSTEAAILRGEVKHADDPCLRWQMSNVVIATDPALNKKIDKQKSSEKVDSVVAMCMAVGAYCKFIENRKFLGDDFEGILL